MIFLDCIFIFLGFPFWACIFLPRLGVKGKGKGVCFLLSFLLSKISEAMEGLMIDGGGSHNKRVSVCFFLGEISPNFDLKNMVSTYTKDFNKFLKKVAWKKKKGRNSPDFHSKKIPKSPEFYGISSSR
jgi:hypothetical protein